jgi:hypothetical protein
MSSILQTVKKMIGIQPDYEIFDADLIVDINAAFMTLQQLGVGPKEGFMISGEDEEWTDFDPSGTLLNAVTQYVFLKTKLVFDPPATSFVLESYNKLIQELEWRMNVHAEGAITS